MEDEETETVTPFSPVKHSKWTFILMAVDLMAEIAQDVAGTLSTATTVVGQHRQHKIHEDQFFEYIRGE